MRLQGITCNRTGSEGPKSKQCTICHGTTVILIILMNPYDAKMEDMVSKFQLYPAIFLLL